MALGESDSESRQCAVCDTIKWLVRRVHVHKAAFPEPSILCVELSQGDRPDRSDRPDRPTVLNGRHVEINLTLII